VSFLRTCVSAAGIERERSFLYGSFAIFETSLPRHKCVVDIESLKCCGIMYGVESEVTGG
jgi:hypothetical protein